MIRFNRRLDFRDGHNTSDLPGLRKRADCNITVKDVGQRRSYDIDTKFKILCRNLIGTVQQSDLELLTSSSPHCK